MSKLARLRRIQESMLKWQEIKNPKTLSNKITKFTETMDWIQDEYKDSAENMEMSESEWKNEELIEACRQAGEATEEWYDYLIDFKNELDTLIEKGEKKIPKKLFKEFTSRKYAKGLFERDWIRDEVNAWQYWYVE